MAKARIAKRSRLGLIVPFIIAALIIGAWSAYYFIARGLLADGIDEWIAAERAEGRILEFERKSLSGFPFRFVLTLDQPVYGETGGVVWSGQQLQLVMQPWDWEHVIVRSPGRNQILPPYGSEGDELRLLLGPQSAASYSWSNESGQMQRGSISLDEVDVSLAGAPLGRAENFEFHLRPPPGEPDMLQVQVNFERIELEEVPGDASALGQVIGPAVLRMEIDQGSALLGDGVPLGAVASQTLMRGGEIRLPQLLLKWGPADLGARGEIVRRNGALAGTLGLRIDNADALREALQAAGLMDDQVRSAIDGLELASRDGGFLIVNVREDGLYVFNNQIVELPLGLWLTPGSL